MELPELPECPVCLQSYDGKYTIPRVLSCGHTACESCLKNLPQKYPQTVRCPACTQLIKYPPQGPSSLPKNIDLLKLIPTSKNPQKPHKQPQNDHPQVHHQDVDFVPRLWSDEFYATWKNWVLPNDAVLVGEKENGDGCCLREGDRKVRILKVGLLNVVNNESGCVFKLSYVAKVMNFLYGMKEEEREELRLVLRVCSEQCRICKVYGLWGDLVDGILYLVCERLNGTVLEKFDHFEDGLSKDGLTSFAMMGMEICEAVIALNLEGLIMGCVGLSCFELDDFGHVSLSLSEGLVMGRAVREAFMETGSGGRKIGSEEMGLLVVEFLKRDTFVSPEVFFEIIKKEGIEIECGSFRYSVGHSSDVWLLACILHGLLFGKQFIEVMVDCVDHLISKIGEENGLHCSDVHRGVIEKVKFLFESKIGEKFEPLQQILCSCLSFDPGSRPLITDVWKCIRELIIRLEFDTMLKLDGSIDEKNKAHHLVLGELCRVPKERSEVLRKDDLQGAENIDAKNLDQVVGVRVDKDFADGLVEGKLKFRAMQGHLGCVTGLAFGGGFLFSSSFDKSVHVWSLQDFSHVHTFKGHEHKVMAVIYVDEEQPLCISGDSGGGIFLWSISIPLGQEPLKKWYEQKDWRYSGIHALTAAGNGYLYTGSGDRLIKAWSLLDGTLSCTMDGHKSVVSTLAACNGVLYSGSWDGTIRLWSLSDHSLLMVLGEDMPGTVTSVLSLVANQNMLVAAHENGHIEVRRNDLLMKTIQPHNGAIFAVSMEGKWLFTGGWDKTVNVQELSGDDFQVDARPIGSIPGCSVVTALLCWQGKLFVGYGDKTLKVYYYGN